MHIAAWFRLKYKDQQQLRKKSKHKIDSPQGTIRWDAFGDGPPLVLLHGTPNWSYLWRKVVPHLAQQHRIYVFDWPGFGTSDRFEGQNIAWDEQPHRLVELFDHWGLDRPAIVAFDIGPIFALRAHYFHGLEYSALVLADAAIVPPFVTDFSRLACDNINIFRQVPTYVSEAVIEAHLRTATYRTLDEETLESYMQPWRGKEGVAAYWRVVESYNEALAQPVADRLNELQIPTLVLWGENDAWLVPTMGQHLADTIPGARLEMVPDAGHFSAEDSPEAFAGQAAEKCVHLTKNLRSCTTYSCELERQLSSKDPDTVLSRYSVMDKEEDETCEYTVHMGGQQIIRCSLTPDSRETVARVAEMQLDESYEKKRAVLLEAVKTIDPVTGEMDLDAEASLDSEFMQLNKDFYSVLESECR